MNAMRQRMHARRAFAPRLRHTKRTAGVLMLAVALAVTGFATASAFAGRSGSEANATLSLRKTDLGQILVSARGRTLYLFMKDMNGRSACSGSCATYWPPLMKTGKLTVGPGLKRTLVGVTKRAGGGLQVTYNKHPLYTFALDKSPGQTKGQGSSNFGAKWYAVSAKGRAVLGTPTTSTTGTTTTTTNPYPPYP